MTRALSLSQSGLAMKLDCEVVIDRPLQEVWDYTNDRANLGLWLNDFLRHEQLTGDASSPKVGDTANMVYQQGKGEFTMLEEVTECDEPNRLVVFMTSKMFDMEIVNTFEAVGADQTKLFAGAEFVRVGLMMKCIMAVSSSKKMLADHVAQINKLKELIEAS